MIVVFVLCWYVFFTKFEQDLCVICQQFGFYEIIIVTIKVDFNEVFCIYRWTLMTSLKAEKWMQQTYRLV